MRQHNDRSNAIEKALYDENFKEVVNKSKNPYGEGKASNGIVKVLKDIEISPKLLQKKITYQGGWKY